ncbi:hypothetical protein BDP27DRAFT_1223677, partial [Rhodocollybia butyracea]
WERHVNSVDFDKQCAVCSRQILLDPPYGGSGFDSFSDRSRLRETDSSSSSAHDVSHFEAHLYYFGIRGPRRFGPKLIFRTSKDVFTMPSGSEQEQPRRMRLLPVYENQALGKDDLWAAIRSKVVKLLDQQNIQHSSIDLVRFSWEDEYDHTTFTLSRTVITTPVTIWVGVLPDTLTAEVAFHSSNDIFNVLKEHGISDIDIAYRESVARSFSGPELFAPATAFDPLKTVIDPLTTKLGLPIADLKRLDLQGMLGFFFRVGEALYAVTARHVLFPADESNEMYTNIGGPKKVVLMGTNAFDNFIKSIQGSIGRFNSVVTVLEKRVQSYMAQSEGGGLSSTKVADKLVETQRELSETRATIKTLKEFYIQMRKHWSNPGDRVIGHVVWSPPISALRGYTKDVCVIKLDKTKFESNFGGNVLDLGPEIECGKFMQLMSSRIDAPSEFDYPCDRLFELQGILSPEEVRTRKDTDHPMRYVIKRGLTTLTTIGCLTGFESHVRQYSALGSRDSVETAVLPYYPLDPFYLRNPFHDFGLFCKGGDSGSIIVDAVGKFVALLTGGTGSIDSPDITYGSPMHWLWEIIKVQFPGADLRFERSDN